MTTFASIFQAWFQSGCGLLSRLRPIFLLLLCMAVPVDLKSQSPAVWWEEGNLVNPLPSKDSGMLAIGQLKSTVWTLAVRLDARFASRGGCGDELRTIVRAWDRNFPAAPSLFFFQPDVVSDGAMLAVANQGQLKNMALIAYRRLKALGLPIVLKDRHPTTGALQDAVVDPDVPATLPWSSGENTAAALVGQLKYCFSFEVPVTSLVVAWGSNETGQLNVPGDLEDAIAVDAGDGHNLALKADGTVVAWGKNDGGQCNVPVGLSGVVAISAAGAHSLALKSDGTVVRWGFNSQGLHTVPAGLNGVVAISAGQGHDLALKNDGTVVAWGSNYDGKTTIPAGLSGVVAIAAGPVHSLALKSDGTVVAWGGDDYGQSTVPAGLSGVVGVAAGIVFSVALKSDGTVVIWGLEGSSQVDMPEGLDHVVAISASRTHVIALKNDGSIVTWGSGLFGATTPPPGLGPVAAVSTGYFQSLALLRR